MNRYDYYSATISKLLVTVRYIGLSNASRLTTFTTIPRLFHDYFIGETTTIGYDYCSPLLAIGRKPEKSCGGSRQWFRAARRAPAAGLPRRVEGARPPCPIC